MSIGLPPGDGDTLVRVSICGSPCGHPVDVLPYIFGKVPNEPEVVNVCIEEFQNAVNNDVSWYPDLIKAQVTI